MSKFIKELADSIVLGLGFILYSLAMMILSVGTIAAFVVLMGGFEQ